MKILKNLFAFTLLAAATTFAAQAQTPTGTFGLHTGTWTSGSSEAVTWNGTVLTVNNGANIVVTTGGLITLPLPGRRIVVNGTATITLDNVSIEGGTVSGVSLNGGADLTLILTGTNTLHGGMNYPGIQVNSGRTLRIDGTGSLTASAGSSSAAGIGGGYDMGGSINFASAGDIIISGGTVITTNTNRGIGRGVAFSYNSSPPVGTLTMNGNAVVITSNVSDTTTARRTGGILFVGNNDGLFYGTSVTPKANFEIPDGRTLTVPGGRTLTISAGITVTNSGSIIPANGSTITVNGTVAGNKINGANVMRPGQGSGSTTTNSITLTAAGLLAQTRQTVEYAISSSNSVEGIIGNWQDERTFSGLAEGTTYYHFARSKANEHFSAGAVLTGGTITTTLPILPLPELEWPSASAIIFGRTLNASTLSGGSTEYGTFAWDNATIRPSVQNEGYSVTFTPLSNYDATGVTLTQTVPVQVNPFDITGVSQIAVSVAGTYVYNGLAHTPTADRVSVNYRNVIVPANYPTLETFEFEIVDVSNNVNAGVNTATVTIAGRGNFTGTATGTFTIAPAPLTLTAEDVEIKLGDPEPAYTYTLTGLVNGETVAVITTPPTFTLNRPFDSSAEGEFTITPSGAVAANYTITHVPGTLTVVDCDHDWGEWEVTTDPTCEAPGEETRTCNLNPEHTETRPVPQLTGVTCDDPNEPNEPNEPNDPNEPDPNDPNNSATNVAAHDQPTPLTAWSHSGTLHVRGLAAGQRWSVYSLSGSIVYQGVADSEEASVALSLPAGVYIVVQGRGSVKVMY